MEEWRVVSNEGAGQGWNKVSCHVTPEEVELILIADTLTILKKFPKPSLRISFSKRFFILVKPRVYGICRLGPVGMSRRKRIVFPCNCLRDFPAGASFSPRQVL